MYFLDRMTGSDITREMKAFDARAERLPEDYRAAWEKIQNSLFAYRSFSGRNLLPILHDALAMLEAASAEGQSVEEALGSDVKSFCAALAAAEGATTRRDRWREELNRRVAKRLEKL